jgi:hypothetical protein
MSAATRRPKCLQTVENELKLAELDASLDLEWGQNGLSQRRMGRRPEWLESRRNLPENPIMRAGNQAQRKLGQSKTSPRELKHLT